VGVQQPVSDHECLRAWRGPCESRCRAEGSGASRWDKTGTVVVGSENNQLAFCSAVTAQVRDLCCLAQPKSLTIPKGIGLTDDHQTDAALVH